MPAVREHVLAARRAGTSRFARGAAGRLSDSLGAILHEKPLQHDKPLKLGDECGSGIMRGATRG
jgi:hypothetical protein